MNCVPYSLALSAQKIDFEIASNAQSTPNTHIQPVGAIV